jgi:N-hydroxyarylamine O-acetyltransferase
MCDHQQYAPESPFRRKKVCSLAREDGRITLTADRLIVTKNGERTETPVDDWEKALYENFGIRPAAARG